MDNNASNKMIAFFDELKRCTLNTEGSDYALFVERWLAELKDIQMNEDVINNYLSKEVDKGDDFQGFVADISDKITGFTNFLRKISTTVQNQRESALSLYNELENIKKIIVKFNKTQHENREKPTLDVSDVSVLLESYDNKINELNVKLNKTEEIINDLNSKVDDRTFNILISTVTILAIFVAVAFAGFGSFSILSTIQLDPKEHILKNTYYLLLVGFFVYNTILLSIHFMFAILNSESLKAKSLFFKKGSKKMSFFEVIDIVLIILIVLVGLGIFIFVP